MTHLGLWGPLQPPKKSPNTPMLTGFAFVHAQNSIVKDYPGLKPPREFLYHVRLPSQCLGGPYHTFGAIGASLRPKNEPEYTQTNQICLCPCSNRIVMGHPSLKSPKECLCYVPLPN